MNKNTQRWLLTGALALSLGICVGQLRTTQKQLSIERDKSAALEQRVSELIPCDSAVKEARRLFDAQLQLRNNMKGDQNVVGYRIP